MISCVRAGDAGCVALLLAAGAGPGVADERGVTAIVLAAEGTSTPVVRLLLDAGADVGRGERGAYSPLCRAALFGRRQIAELLMERGARVSLVCDGDHGDTPLITALRGAMLAGLPNNLKENFVVKDGDGDDEGGDGEAGGSDAAEWKRDEATLREVAMGSAEDFLAIARSLLARGADVNAVAKCDGGETALLYAAMGANVEMVKALLARGADVDEGAPLLSVLADAERDYERTKRLAPPALSKEQTAMLAWFERTRAAQAEIVRLLRAAGAEEGESRDGRTDDEALEELAREAFGDAVEEDDVEDLARLADAYAAHPLGPRLLTEALRIAVIFSRTEMVELLLARGVSPDPPASSPGGFTALMHAAHDGKLDYVRMLLDAGADVNRKDDKGQTALDSAESWARSREEYRPIVALLKARGTKSGGRE